MSVASTLESDVDAIAKKIETKVEDGVAAVEVDLSTSAGQAQLASELAAALTKATPLIEKLAAAAGANAGTVAADIASLISGLTKLGTVATATGI